VLRIFSGDFVTGEISGKPAGQGLYFLIAVIMLIPILMVVLSLVVPYPAIRWATIVVAVLLVAFNAVGLPYPSAYDSFLIVVSMVFNVVIVWLAWRWV